MFILFTQGVIWLEDFFLSALSVKKKKQITQLFCYKSILTSRTHTYFILSLFKL